MILLQAAASTVPIARDISQMSQATADQSMLIYVLIAAYAPLVTVIGILWRKWEDARQENKDATKEMQTMIREHASEKQQMILESNKTSQQLGAILAKLDK